MFHRFTNCFTFLLHHNPIITGPRRRRTVRTSSRSLCSTNSFLWDDDEEAIGGESKSNQFKQVFKLIDANGDGKISVSELSDIIVCLGGSPKQKKRKGLAVKEAEGIVRVLDFNGDGFVDLDEFMMVVMKEDEEEEEGEGEGEEEGEGELKDAFEIYDSDGNGLISAKELRRVMVNLGWSDCSIRDCDNMIRAVDLNGDGFVDFHEFSSMMRSHDNNSIPRRRTLPNP